MDLSKLDGMADAQKAIEQHTSSRARLMAELEAYVKGTQYIGKPDWFEDGPRAKPLWERAPCFVYPIVDTAIGSNADLLFGEGRFPSLTSRPAEDDAAVTADGLTLVQAESLDKLIGEIERQVRWSLICRQVFTDAQGTKSGCALFGVRSQKLFCDTVKARWCTPTFDRDKNVATLVIEYPYLVEYVNERTRKRSVRPMMYRRVIDAMRDITMKPAELKPDMVVDIKWAPDPDQSFDHGLGFCPAVWYAHLKECSTVSNFDGHAIHENLTDEIRAHDFAISQRHRAALYTGDPQWTEIGVDDHDGPRASGRTANVPSSLSGGTLSTDNPQTGRYPQSRDASRARRKSPGSVWKYESPDVKVQLHCLPGDALKALSDHAKDLRSKLCESMGVVFFDSEDFKGGSGDVSGRALEARKSRQIEACDLYREDFGHGFMLPGMNMLLRIAHTVGKTKGTLRLSGLPEAMSALDTFSVEDGDALAGT